MFEKQNKHYAFNVFPERPKCIYTLAGKSWTKSEFFVSLQACSFYYDGIANFHQMKTHLSLSRSIVQLVETFGNHKIAE